MPPRNLRITRPMAQLVSAAGCVVAIVALIATIVIYGIDEVTAPVILPLAGSLGLAMSVLVSALKSTEAADTAARSARTLNLTASQLATLQMSLNAAIAGATCPAGKDCPMRSPGDDAP